ncbi:MAG: ATP-dependent DNA helicase RecG [Vampirovibrionales bacterium]|nr:ATP-dependent DNA helicase RecG [Vampirovibrionales bacterium]
MSREEASLLTGELRQAIDYERRYQYVDVQGRRKPFSRFIQESLSRLEAHLRRLVDDGALFLALETLTQKFRQYAAMDLSQRMGVVERLEQFLALMAQTLAAPQRPAQRYANASPPEGDAAQTDPMSAPVQFLRGVGPRLAKLLAQVGVETIADLLYYFPRHYVDYQNRAAIHELTPGQDVTVIGAVVSANARMAKSGNVAILTLTVTDGTGRLTAAWFYAKTQRGALEQFKARFVKGADVMLSGRVKLDGYNRCFALEKPQAEILSYEDAGGEGDAPPPLNAGRIVPIYPLTQGLNLSFLRRAIHQALGEFSQAIIDPLPETIRSRYELVGLREALAQIHFPESLAQHQAARKRLVFDELFWLQCRLALLRAQYKRTARGLALARREGGYCDRLLAMLPFSLTGAQTRVFSEIQADLASPEPMYRLLQGDVGSGKTIVALLTLLIAVENGYQGALMAPTEILAEQHYRKFVEWLLPLGLRVGLLTGAATAPQRREVRQGLLNGQIHIAVGTHALIQRDVDFHALGVIVVDEQHRFGVRQRTLLKNKGEHPDMLTMTATPIPRTLAMTLHGDLDVSLLDELPPGRTPIVTSLLTRSKARQAYELIRHEVSKGRQAYIVFPLIEESEALEAKAAVSEAQRLQRDVFPDLRVGLMHGKMPSDEKDAVMAAFTGGQLDILVSTTVVEVGVDVPNATVMLIENADRFGLAQLHQLRGRVGRGQSASYCVLISDSRSDDSLQRLTLLCESQNGFEIAERDLALRGPGEFLGTRQSGLPDFALADLVQDHAILEMAREAAFELTASPEALNANARLKSLVFEKTDHAFAALGAG